MLHCDKQQDIANTVPWRWVCLEFGTKSNGVSDRAQFTSEGFAGNSKLAELGACHRTRKEFKMLPDKLVAEIGCNGITASANFNI